MFNCLLLLFYFFLLSGFDCLIEEWFESVGNLSSPDRNSYGAYNGDSSYPDCIFVFGGNEVENIYCYNITSDEVILWGPLDPTYPNRQLTSPASLILSNDTDDILWYLEEDARITKYNLNTKTSIMINDFFYQNSFEWPSLLLNPINNDELFIIDGRGEHFGIYTISTNTGELGQSRNETANRPFVFIVNNEYYSMYPYIYMLGGRNTDVWRLRLDTGNTLNQEWEKFNNIFFTNDTTCNTNYGDIVSAGGFLLNNLVYIIGGQDVSAKEESNCIITFDITNHSINFFNTFDNDRRISRYASALTKDSFYILGGCTGTGDCPIESNKIWYTNDLTPTQNPTSIPTIIPTYPSYNPTTIPSHVPSVDPTNVPSYNPSHVPTNEPTMPTTVPTNAPSDMPSIAPSTQPSAIPSNAPSNAPSTVPSGSPSSIPSNAPSDAPSIAPSDAPSAIPSNSPSNAPSSLPTAVPTNIPSMTPSSAPSSLPTITPSNAPTDSPTNYPSYNPSNIPSNYPSIDPTSIPSNFPSIPPTRMPSYIPSIDPTNYPSYIPSLNPSNNPSYVPSNSPTTAPTVSTGIDAIINDITNLSQNGIMIIVISLLLFCIFGVLCCFIVVYLQRREKKKLAAILEKRNENNSNKVASISHENRDVVGNGDKGAIELNTIDTQGHIITNGTRGSKGGESINDNNVPSKVGAFATASAAAGGLGTPGGPITLAISDGNENNGNSNEIDGDGSTLHETGGISKTEWKNWDENNVIEWLNNELKNSGFKNDTINKFLLQFKTLNMNGNLLNEWLNESNGDVIYLTKKFQNQLTFSKASMVWDVVIQAIFSLNVNSM